MVSLSWFEWSKYEDTVSGVSFGLCSKSFSSIIFSLNSEPLMLFCYNCDSSKLVFVTGKRNHRVLPEGARRWRDHPGATLDSLLPSPASPQANLPWHQPTSPSRTRSHTRCFYPAAHRCEGQQFSGHQAGQQRTSGRQPNRYPGWYTWRSVTTDDLKIRASTSLQFVKTCVLTLK